MEVMYQLLTVAVLAAGCLSGIRRGITRQMGSLLGASFGTVGAAMIAPQAALWITQRWPELAMQPPMPMFLPLALGVALVYCAIYLLMLCTGSALNSILHPMGKGVFNMILGALWGIAKWAMLLSLFFNILIGYDHNSPLLEASMHGDGNVASAVMLIAPALTGTPDCDELAYSIQMMNAREFDRNHGCHENVIK